MPQPARTTTVFMHKASCLPSLLALFATFAGALAMPAARAQSEDPMASLAVLYNERHRLVAFKDACSRVLPKLRRETQAAYEEWLDRHEDVLENLEARFLVMVKKVSRNQKEYNENYRKYRAVIEQERQAQKDAFLAMPKEDLVKECREYPAYLRSENSDMPNRYPEEFAALYGKRKP